MLLNRLSVENGLLVTPEGIKYRLLWLPDVPRMLPETLEKIQSLIRDGATVVGNPPQGLATLQGGAAGKRRFDAAVKGYLGGTERQKHPETIGKGQLLSGMPLERSVVHIENCSRCDWGGCIFVVT